MKIFGRTPTAVEAAEAAVAKARQKRERIGLQLNDAARELDQRKAAAADAALNENAVDVADRASGVATAAATFEALEHAVGVASSELAAAQQALAVERDRAERAASIVEVRGLIAEIEAWSQPLTTAVADLVKVFAAARILRPTTSSLEAVLHASNLRHGIINDEGLE